MRERGEWKELLLWGVYCGSKEALVAPQRPLFLVLLYGPNQHSLRETLKEVICLFSPALYQPHTLSVWTSGELDSRELISPILCPVVEMFAFLIRISSSYINLIEKLYISRLWWAITKLQFYSFVVMNTASTSVLQPLHNEWFCVTIYQLTTKLWCRSQCWKQLRSLASEGGNLKKVEFTPCVHMFAGKATPPRGKQKQPYASQLSLF